MARFAPNFYHQYLELPVRERFAAAKESGFDALEWHFPYEIPASEMKLLLDDNGLQFTYAVMPVDWGRDLGLAGIPGREDDCRRVAEEGLRYLSAIGADFMQVGAGVVPEGIERSRCIDVFVANLDWICRAAAGSGVRIAVEGVCHARFPCWVNRTISETAAIVRAVGRPEIKLVYDTYHLRMEEKGPLLPLLDDYWDLIGHVQIRNAPMPLEPGRGEIDLYAIIDALDKNGWAAPIGLEFDTSSDTWTSMRWLARYGYPDQVAPQGVTIGHATRRINV